jgi:hypothetical protein
MQRITAATGLSKWAHVTRPWSLPVSIGPAVLAGVLTYKCVAGLTLCEVSMQEVLGMSNIYVWCGQGRRSGITVAKVCSCCFCRDVRPLGGEPVQHVLRLQACTATRTLASLVAHRMLFTTACSNL